MLNNSLLIFARRLSPLGLAAAVLFAAPAAQAQWFNLGFGLRPDQVEREIFASGYQLTGPVSRNGGVYLADVVDRSGARQRLVVDATSGRLLQRFRGRRDSYGYADTGEPIPRPPALVESRLVGEPPVATQSMRQSSDQLQARSEDSPFSIFNLTPAAPTVIAPDAVEKTKHKPAVVKHRKIDTAPVAQPASAPAPSAPAAEAPAATPESPTIIVAPTPTPAAAPPAAARAQPAPAAQEPRVADTKPAPVTATPAKPRKPVLNDLPVNTLE